MNIAEVMGALIRIGGGPAHVSELGLDGAPQAIGLALSHARRRGFVEMIETARKNSFVWKITAEGIRAEFARPSDEPLRDAVPR